MRAALSHGVCVALVVGLAGCTSFRNTLDPALARQVDAAMTAEMERQELVGAAAEAEAGDPAAEAEAGDR